MQSTPTRIGAPASGSAKLRVWVTRAQPGADQTAERLSRLGHLPIVAPVLTVRPIASAAPDLQGVAAIAFTSANAVRLFAELSPARALPVFAVGEATAACARAAGFAEVHTAGVDVGSLADRLIRAGENDGLRHGVPPLQSGEGGPPKAVEEATAGAASRPASPPSPGSARSLPPASQGGTKAAPRLAAQPGREILHVRGRDVAGDLAGVLAARGLRLREAVLYETVEADALPDTVAQAIRHGALGAVLIHSPKAARVIARLLAQTGRDQAGLDDLSVGGVRLVALSTACAEPLMDLGFAEIATAATPNDSALLQILAL